MDEGGHGCGRGNIQQISYIPQTEQHSPFGLMLLCLENVTIVYITTLSLKYITIVLL